MIRTIINPRLYFPLVLILSLSAMFFGCEGPAGADGTDGTDGDAGLAGIDGVDANETCKVCHNDEDVIVAIQAQWAASGHNVGGHYRNTDPDCAVCHTSQGALEVWGTGETETTAAIVNGAPPNCRTCHMIHETYTVDDWDRRGVAAVAPWQDPSASIDLGGDSNLCVNCHQVRATDLPAITAAVGVPADSLVLGDWDHQPHGAVQGNVVAGVAAGWDVEGDATYANSTHKAAGCITCHMADPGRGNQAGGHTMYIAYEGHRGPSFWDEGCYASCHEGDDVEVMMDDLALEFDPLLEEIADSLFSRGLLDTSDGEFELVDGEYNGVEAGAYYNWVLIGDSERSGGVHNPRYIRALLANTVEALIGIAGE